MQSASLIKCEKYGLKILTKMVCTADALLYYTQNVQFTIKILRFFHLLTLLPPATKLGQGYIFTGICHSVNRGVVCSQGVPAPGGSAPRGVPAPKGVPAPGGACSWWGACSGECLVETPRDGHCCGPYASYWNAFLF